MPIELEFLAIQINATPAQISDIVAKSRDVWQDHVQNCSDCQQCDYSCYDFDETTPILRVLCPEDCPDPGPDSDLCIMERDININMFMVYFPTDWFIKAT
jgi:hypothetical protein